MTDISRFGFADDVEFVKYLVSDVGVAAVPGSSFYRDAGDGARQVRFCLLQKVGDAGRGGGKSWRSLPRGLEGKLLAARGGQPGAAVPAQTCPTETAPHKNYFVITPQGDAVAGVAGGIGLHVVGFGVDDNRCAAVGEQGVGAGGEGDVVVLEFHAGAVRTVDIEVVHVAGMMAVGIFQSVFFGFRIKVRAGGFEVGAVAIWDSDGSGCRARRGVNRRGRAEAPRRLHAASGRSCQWFCLERPSRELWWRRWEGRKEATREPSRTRAGSSFS